VKINDPFQKHEPAPKSSSDDVRRDVVLIPAEPPGDRNAPPEDGRRRFSKRRLFLAFLIAAASDIAAVVLSWLPPAIWALDVATAVALFVVLGWSWFLLPGLLLEAIPGVEMLPFWILVVGAIAIVGHPRPRLK
jgi:hypothetical protein